MKLSKELMKHLSKADELLERLKSEEVSRYLTRDLKARLKAEPEDGLESFSEETEVETSLSEEQAHFLEEGKSGLEKFRLYGEEADLTASQKTGLEAIVFLTHRPAILVQHQTFLQVPQEWQILNTLRDGINKTIQSVGRIEVSGHPNFDWLGTGFLVAEDVVMTNRHVAMEFTMGSLGNWQFKPGMAGQIDYKEEFGVLEHAEFRFTEVIGIHEVYDLALLRVEHMRGPGVFVPSPLSIAARPPEIIDGRTVFACGYPASDSRRNDPREMIRIFSNIFDVKRIQPGELRRFDSYQNVVMHDCSTLGGNSGSCIVDLETNQVLGLHFGGRYLEGNYAVALWCLTDDSLLKKAKVNFN